MITFWENYFQHLPNVLQIEIMCKIEYWKPKFKKNSYGIIKNIYNCSYIEPYYLIKVIHVFFNNSSQWEYQVTRLTGKERYNILKKIDIETCQKFSLPLPHRYDWNDMLFIEKGCPTRWVTKIEPIHDKSNSIIIN